MKHEEFIKRRDKLLDAMMTMLTTEVEVEIEKFNQMMRQDIDGSGTVTIHEEIYDYQPQDSRNLLVYAISYRDDVPEKTKIYYFSKPVTNKWEIIDIEEEEYQPLDFERVC